MKQDCDKDVCLSVPCRKAQIELLVSLLGEPNYLSPASLFIYGHTGTGKSLVINTIAEKLKLPYVLVNCVECYSSKLIYELILNEASGNIPSPENEYSSHARCDNMNDFVKMISTLLQSRQQETFYVVLDKVERLRDMDINLLPGFLRLQELTGMNISVILLSEIVWEKYRTGTGFLEPFTIHFPDYSKDEMLEIMTGDCPAEYPMVFYQNYCNLLLSVFHSVCRNLNELTHLASLNFPKYIEPIQNGTATAESTSKLWRNIEPHLRRALHTVYLREVSSAQWERMQQENEENNSSGSTNMSTGQVATCRANLELPFYSKYLLIAAYLASYNPMKTDKRFFATRDSKMSKRAQLAQMKRNERTSNQLLGPKPFPLDRLMAIFYAIVDGKVAPTANIFCQITSLTTLGLMTQTASIDLLEAPKYKCLVSLEFVQSIARTVNFDVAAYVYDLL